jgi:hypothetical protein
VLDDGGKAVCCWSRSADHAEAARIAQVVVAGAPAPNFSQNTEIECVK